MKGIKGLAELSIGTGLLPQNEKLRGWLSWTRRGWFWLTSSLQFSEVLPFVLWRLSNCSSICFIVFHSISIVLVPPNRQISVAPCAEVRRLTMRRTRRSDRSASPPPTSSWSTRAFRPEAGTGSVYLGKLPTEDFSKSALSICISYTCHMSKIVSRFPAVSVSGWVPRLLEPYNPQRGSRKHPPSCTELEQQLGAPLGAGCFFGFSTNQTYLYSKTLYSGSLLTLVLLLYTNANYIWYIYTNYNMISINFITLVYFMSYKFYCRVLDSWTFRKV